MEIMNREKTDVEFEKDVYHLFIPLFSILDLCRNDDDGRCRRKSNVMMRAAKGCLKKTRLMSVLRNGRKRDGGISINITIEGQGVWQVNHFVIWDHTS